MPSEPFVPELPPLNLEDVRLRLAEEADYAFLRALYRQVRAAELAPVPWSEAEKHAFCDSQFALQDQHYRKHYAHSAFFVIERAGLPIGRLYLNLAPGPLGVMDISIDAAVQGQGLGTALMQWLAGWADQEGRDMQLFVEANNPARRLYTRLGFVEQDQEGIYLRMRRTAALSRG